MKWYEIPVHEAMKDTTMRDLNTISIIVHDIIGQGASTLKLIHVKVR